jgi:hypothetical protein
MTVSSSLFFSSPFLLCFPLSFLFSIPSILYRQFLVVCSPTHMRPFRPLLLLPLPSIILYPIISPSCLIFHKLHDSPASCSSFFSTPPPATGPSGPICPATLRSHQYLRPVSLVTAAPFSSELTYLPHSTSQP